jgi:hypothetical protein
MKFFSLIINHLHKSLRNIHIYFDVPLAFELEMNLLYIIKQQQNNKRTMALFDQSYYDEQYNVTKWLGTFESLVEYYNERKGKASKTRFINIELQDAYDKRADLIKALKDRPDGMLHGARHTYRDLQKLDKHIENILKLKNL